MLRRQSALPHARFSMPDYVSALQANMSHPVDAYCARIARLTGTVEIIAHPSPARDPDFPSDMHYGPTPRFAESQYLIRVVDRLRQLGIAT